jgi:glycerol kinase
VLRNNSTVLSALGAAYLAGLTVGVWASQDEIAALPRSIDQFEPRLTATERESLVAGWRQAIARTLFKP